MTDIDCTGGNSIALNRTRIEENVIVDMDAIIASSPFINNDFIPAFLPEPKVFHGTKAPFAIAISPNSLIVYTPNIFDEYRKYNPKDESTKLPILPGEKYVISSGIPVPKVSRISPKDSKKSAFNHFLWFCGMNSEQVLDIDEFDKMVMRNSDGKEILIRDQIGIFIPNGAKWFRGCYINLIQPFGFNDLEKNITFLIENFIFNSNDIDLFVPLEKLKMYSSKIDTLRKLFQLPVIQE